MPTRRCLPRRVDPRVCGGAYLVSIAMLDSEGRSPRLRGSHRLASQGGGGKGSIPASAGEPSTTASCNARRRVDPRVCGGAPSWPASPSLNAGRSPRLRGSHDADDPEARDGGSIPASAGEPQLRRALCRAAGVDPRVCGGAVSPRPIQRPPLGRSPRLRGSPRWPRADVLRPGSIPASAGEPRPRPCRCAPPRVDPRVCGGAAEWRMWADDPMGRSPRLRGSHAVGPADHRAWRSIPASAGEPLAANT